MPSEPTPATTASPPKGDADVLRDLAYLAQHPAKIEEGYRTLVVPDAHVVEYIDTEFVGPQPTRKRGTVTLHDAGSFSAYVNRHKVAATTTIYADALNYRFVGVVNDASAADPQWADHRAILNLLATEEWTRWSAKDGAWFEQEPFAEFIEEGIDQIHKPTAAEMLELATTFHATTSATFRQATVLASGERKLHYDESIEARTGRTGELSVPTTFELALIPFEGSPAYKVLARLRYRVSGGKLTMGYKLIGPRDVQRDAFGDTCAEIEAGTGVPTFAGTPPEGVGR